MKKQYRVLLIVPEIGLDVIPEIDSIFDNDFLIQPIQTVVTRERIMQVIRNREFDIIHFAGHADKDGLQISNNEKIEAPTLVQIARSVKASLVFLNGCETTEIGQVLVDEHVPAAICTLRRVEGMVARETAQVFYKALAQTGDIRAAYNMSKPPIKGGYTLLTNGLNDASMSDILEKLAEFGIFIARNDAEHRDLIKTNAAEHTAILQMISANELEHSRIMKVLMRSRIWSVVVMVVGMVGIGIIVGIFTLVGRGVVP